MFFLNHQKEPKNEPQTGGVKTVGIPLVGYLLFLYRRRRQILLHLTSPKSYQLICLNTWYFLSYQKVHIILKELLTVGVGVAHLFEVLG